MKQSLLASHFQAHKGQGGNGKQPAQAYQRQTLYLPTFFAVYNDRPDVVHGKRIVNVAYLNFSKAIKAVFHSSFITTSWKYSLDGWATKQRKVLLHQQPVAQ